jgi:hypothetical protein
MRVATGGGPIVKSIMLILAAIGLLLPITATPSRAAEPEMWLWGQGGNPADIEREVLWIDTPDFAGVTGSSEVIGAFDLWSEVAADFFLEAEATIRKVTWWGGYWNGFEEPTGAGFNLRFYHEGGDCLPEDAPLLEYLLPGDDCCETLADGGDQFSQFVYERCLNLPLASGHYWFSAQMADHEFPPQWGRLEARPLQACDSAFRSPFFSYPEWVPGEEAGHIFEPFEFSQMFEDVCEPTAVETASWGRVKGLYQ